MNTQPRSALSRNRQPASLHGWRRSPLGRILFFCLWFVAAGLSALANDSLPVTAVASDGPPHVKLSWTRLAVPTVGGYVFYSLEIRRRPYGSSTPTLLTTITDPTVRSYVDTTVVKGVLYEYLCTERYNNSAGAPPFWPFPDATWVASGVEVPVNDAPGTVLILVDQVSSGPLASRLALFERDLAGAGWKTVRATVAADTNTPGDGGPAAATSDPRPTKQVITATLAANPDLKAVVLVGRITIPFSGNNDPDGHGTRAMATDAYYADTNESWTDTTAFSSQLQPANIRGDLRWDKTELANGRELMVGRVDFRGMTSFAESEVQLLDRYFHKNHAFRGGFTQATRQGFWTTNAPIIYEAISNMMSYFGGGAVLDQGQTSWAAVTANDSYLWAAAGATGNYDGTAGINTAEMATSDYKVVFATAGSSYMMETWRNNSAIRGLIAMPTWGIGSIVSHGYYSDTIYPGFSMGRPLGEINLGPNERYPRYLPELSGQYAYFLKNLYANLFGDPTVTMYVTLPPSNLTVSQVNGAAQLTWDASPASGLVGYHIYRSSGWGVPFTRLTPTPVTGTTYTDSTARSTAVLYMVRAVNLETRGTGTYLAASQGVFAPFSLAGVSNTRPTATRQNLTLPPNTSLLVTLGGTDPDGDMLTPVIMRPPQNGRLVMEGSDFRYVPKPGYTGTDSFQFLVNDGYQDSPSVTSVLAVTNDTPLNAWRQANFGTTANTGNAADLADPDGDGLVNLLEFALGTNPTTANPSPIATATAGGHLTLTFNRLEPAAVTYTVEASTDLQAWTTVATLPANTSTWTPASGATVTETGTGASRSVTFTDAPLLSASPKRFLRLRVTEP